MSKVSINAPKTPVTKGSNGIASATLPNVCKMPGPPAPFVPAPLPNIGKSGKDVKGYSKSVLIEGKAVAIAGASFGSMGDIASKATGGGMISMNVEGPTKFIGPGSFDVQIEGKNVQLLGDPMLNNCGPSGAPANAATMTGLVQEPGGEIQVRYGDDTMCPLCEEVHPPITSKATQTSTGKIFASLERQFKEQRDDIERLHHINGHNFDELNRELVQIEKAARKTSQPISAQDRARALELKNLVNGKPAAETLKRDLGSRAVMRFDDETNTFSKGYMVGALICRCRATDNHVAACSGRAPPGFLKAVREASPFRQVGPAVGEEMPSSPLARSWFCAARWMLDAIGSHEPADMLERYFYPQIIRSRPPDYDSLYDDDPRRLMCTPGSTSPIRISIFVERDDGSRRQNTRSKNHSYMHGEITPSCHKCQEAIPRHTCGKKCPGGQ